MKKIFALVCAGALLLSGCAGAGKEAPQTTGATVGIVFNTLEPAPLAAENLTIRTAELQAQTWSSPNGATVYLKAQPSAWFEGLEADFVVRLEGEEVALSRCTYEDGWFTASVELEAENGLCYYVILKSDGTRQEAAVNTPAEPKAPELIDLKDSLASYGSLILEGSRYEDGVLTLEGGQIQLQAPRIHNMGQEITCESAALVLTQNGQTLAQAQVELLSADESGKFTASMDGIRFAVSGVEEDQQVWLQLVAQLSNGQQVTASGVSMVFGETGLVSAVG